MSTSAGEQAPTLRKQVFRMLETAQENDRLSRFVDLCLIALISASVLAVILESMPSMEKRYSEEFSLFEIFTVAVFSIEYLLRIWSAVEFEESAGLTALQARLKYMTSFHAIVDLLAILPFYLLAFGVFGNVDMRFLRAVRLLRVLKLTRYSAAMNMLIITFRENGKALGAAFLILVTVMLMAASGMYYFERQVQPEDFGSIPAAMWWAFATLTTVGYGDVTPITVGGKVFGALITVVGIGMVALPTSILATGYSHQLKLSTTTYSNRADEALDDGYIDEEEARDLEELRVDLGLGKHTASQILDAGMVRRALQRDGRHPGSTCPHCQRPLETDSGPS
ncbi:MAG: ion transporter [Woeseiaceae bacterium]|nr:ion transporter [Woeseiaceae bacterium]